MNVDKFGLAIFVFFFILFVQELFSKDEESDLTNPYS